MKNRPFLKLVILLMLSTITLQAKQKLAFEPPRGFYLEPFQLTITAPVENATIRYTLDGTDPMTSSKSDASPLTLTINPEDFTGRDKAPAVCVRAIAVVADTAASNLNTHTYIFPEKVSTLSLDGQRPGTKWPRPGREINDQLMDYGMDNQVYNHPNYRDKMLAAMTDIPSMSMVMDLDDLFDPDFGIYVNAAEHGEEWERPCSLELINPDGSDGFHINCGVRIRGGYSRVPRNPKHAFRYFFRGDYGESKLRHPLFDDEGVDEFDKIDLRTSQNYSWAYGAGNNWTGHGSEANTMLRDVFSRDAQGDMGQPYTRSRYYHLFINGTYWGLFQTQERSEASFAAEYFGGDREDYDAVKVDAGYGRPYVMEATDGNLNAWNTLWDMCEEDPANQEVYYRMQGLNADGSNNPDYPKYLDVDNTIDYMLNAFFLGDFDAPVSKFSGDTNPNNFWGTFNRVNPDGFKLYRHDAEHVALDVNEDRTGPYDAGNIQEKFNPQWLHQKLTGNAEYLIRFSDRVYSHFFNDGALTQEANIARLMKRKNQIDNAIIAESARWGDTRRDVPYTRDNEWLDQVDYLVDDYFVERNAIVLDQFIGKGWYPSFQPPEFNSRDAIVDKGFQLSMTTSTGKIYYTDDGSNVYGDLSGGGLQMQTVSPWAADKRALVPSNDIGNVWRTSIDFDDSDWDLVSGAPGGIGYEKGSGYESLVSLDVAKYMHEDDTNTPNASCYVRIPFNVTEQNLQEMVMLRAQMRYDDGYVLYLNGLRVSSNLAPDQLDWNSMATDNHEADDIENIDLSNYISRLKVGKNVLAIHALNVSLNSSDFIVMAQLQAGYEKESSGNIISPTAQEYTTPITIDKTTQFKARVLQGGKWSALNSILLSVDEDMNGLRATEIHYNPIPDGEGETKVDGDLFEFFELKNIGSSPINMTGAQFTKGIKYNFPAGVSMNPGDFYVVCSSAEHFKSRYNFEAHGQYIGNLSNGGERVVLLSATGDTIINIKYNDKLPWPPAADSTGQSLVAYATQPQGDPGEPEYWKVSAKIHGSPNADDLASPVAEESTYLPTVYRLYQNYPNPFNPTTTVRFEAPKDGHISVVIYNSIGQKVDVLTDHFEQAGVHQLNWDGTRYAGGVYFIRMEAAEFEQTVKILLLK